MNLERGFKIMRGKLQSAMLGLLSRAGQRALDELARMTASLDAPQVTLKGPYKATFNGLSPKAIEFAKTQSGKLIQDITDDQLKAVRDIMSRSFSEGIEPRRTAVLLEDVIGLRSDQWATLEAQREEWRDEGYTEAEIAEESAAFAGDAIKARAYLIARHETIVASYAGAREGWRQAKEEGLLGDEAVQEWVGTEDGRMCPECEDLVGETAKLDEPFAPGIYQPGDPHPQCRCAIVMRPYGVDNES